MSPSARQLILVAVALGLLAVAGCIGPIGEDPGIGSPATAEVGSSEIGFSGSPYPEGDYETEGPWSQPLQEGPYDVGETEVVTLESEVDGADIQIGVVRPELSADEEVPVIAVASIYLPDLEGEDLTNLNGGSGPAFSFDYGEYYAQTWVPHGYAVAFVPVRGQGGSGGCWEVTGPREQADLDQAVTWLGTRDWSNGNVAMTGRSYDGTTAWATAAQGNPHLETIVPVGAVTDRFHHFFQNGTVETRAPWYTSTSLFPTLDPFAQENNVCPTTARGLAASLESSLTGEPDRTGYWEQRRFREDVLANYDGSVLLAHGLQDDNVPASQVYPFLNRLRDEGVPTKVLLGQWGHVHPDQARVMDEPRWDWAEQLHRWFDHWLTEDERADLGARVQVEDSQGRWRTGETWPPRGSHTAIFHLAPGGQLSPEASQDTARVPVGPDETVATGNHARSPTGCAHCATFVTEPLDEELRFAGAPEVALTVVPTGPTGHLTAHLYAAADEWRPLGLAMMDLRFAEGGEEAEPVVPGQETVARLRVDPLDAVAPEGARLVLVVSQGTEADATDPRSTMFAGDRTALVPPSPVLLSVGGEQSSLQVDTFERDPATVFSPPR